MAGTFLAGSRRPNFRLENLSTQFRSDPAHCPHFSRYRPLAGFTSQSKGPDLSSETLERMLHTESLRHLAVPTCPHCGKKIE